MSVSAMAFSARQQNVVWALAALLGVALLVLMAFFGEERSGALAENSASGVAKALAPDRIRAVEVMDAGQAAQRFVRVEASAPWRRLTLTGADQRTDISPAQAKKLSELVMLLHHSPPERSLPAEARVMVSYGLSPAPTLRVALWTSDAMSPPPALPALRVEFGGLNPMGIATYARASTAPTMAEEPVLLLPAYIADTARAVLQP